MTGRAHRRVRLLLPSALVSATLLAACTLLAIAATGALAGTAGPSSATRHAVADTATLPMAGTLRVDVRSRQNGGQGRVGTSLSLDAVIVCTQGSTSARIRGDITFLVDGANKQQVTVPARDLEFPQAFWSYQGLNAGRDVIKGTASNIGEACPGATPIDGSTVSFTWTTGPRLTLAADSSTSRVGRPVAVTATYTVDDKPETGATVRFLIQGNGEPLRLAATTDSQGRATVTYQRDSAGTDNINAEVTTAELSADPITHVWVLPKLAISLQPDGPTTQVPGSYRVTATLTADGDPLPGITVRFEATPPGTVSSATTDADGRATITLSCSTEGPVTVGAAASATALGQTATSSVTHTCTKPPELAVVLEPAGTTSLVESSFAVTATLLEAGKPVPNAPVRVTAHLPGEADKEATVTTDTVGQATFEYTRTRPGTDTITASANVEGREATTTIVHHWEPNHGLRIGLAPAGTTSAVGTSFTVTATVSDLGRPLVGAHIALRASMPEAPEQRPALVTDANGAASYTYTRDRPGSDTVSATVRVAGRTGTATVVHLWKADVTLALGLAPAGTTTEVRTPFTATATVTTQGRGKAGIPVAVRVTGPSGQTLTRSVVSGREGVATFTYTRTQPGTDTVAAVATTSGHEAKASIVHLWRAAAARPAAAGSGIRLDRRSSPPGGDLRASGFGCRPGDRVFLLVASHPVGTATADASGRYRLLLRLPSLPIGQYTVTAACGSTVSEAPLDLVAATSTSGTAEAAGITTAAVFGFFVLVGAQLLNRGDVTTPTPPGGSGP